MTTTEAWICSDISLASHDVLWAKRSDACVSDIFRYNYMSDSNTGNFTSCNELLCDWKIRSTEIKDSLKSESTMSFAWNFKQYHWNCRQNISTVSRNEIWIDSRYQSPWFVFEMVSGNEEATTKVCLCILSPAIARLYCFHPMCLLFACVCWSRYLPRWSNYEKLVPHKQCLAGICMGMYSACYVLHTHDFIDEVTRSKRK